MKSKVTNNIINNNLFKNANRSQLNYKFFNIFNFKVNMFNINLNININTVKNNNNKDNNEDYKNKRNENIKK